MVKILVTGSSGHIGSALVPKLFQELGCWVIGFERYNSHRYGLPSTFDTVYGDITDFSAVHRVIRKEKPEVIIHLAALATQDQYAYDNWEEMMRVNLMGTINLVEACFRENIQLKRFLHASSCEVYGSQYTPLREDMGLYAQSPYNVSKIAAELYLTYAYKVYKLPLVLLRPFQTYGFGKRRTVIESAINQMLTSDEVCLGDPTAIRDWMHITDHVNAYLTCLEHPKAIGEPFNFCTGVGTSVRQVVEMLQAICDFKGEIKWNTQPPRPNDIPHLVGNPTKANKLLNWQTKTPLKEGLEMEVERWRKELS